jgi:hypothetical protein
MSSWWLSALKETANTSCQKGTKDTPIAMDETIDDSKHSTRCAVGTPLTREEAFKYQTNRHVFAHEPSKTRAYLVHFFYDNEEELHNWGAYQVCVYYGVWHQVIQDKETGKPTLGEFTPEVHNYNSEDVTNSKDSEEEQECNQLNDEIRRSPVTLSPTAVALTMSTMQMTLTVTITYVRTVSSRPAAGGTTLASL